MIGKISETPPPTSGEALLPDHRREQMRLAIIMRWLAPYRNSLYDEIGLRLAASDEVTIFTGNAGKLAHYPWEPDALRLRHAQIVCVPALRVKHGWLAVTDWANPVLWRQLSKFNPTHLWIHEFSPYVLLGLAWAKAHGRPCFVSTEIGDNFPGRFTPTNKRFHHFIMRRCNGVIAYTQRAYETAQQTGRRALFVPHAVDTRTFVPRAQAAKGVPEGKVRVLQVGVLNERKGIDLLLKAFRRCGRCPSPGAGTGAARRR